MEAMALNQGSRMDGTLLSHGMATAFIQHKSSFSSFPRR